MLRSPKNSVLHLAPPSHMDVFVEHYEQLKKWAHRFTDHDKDAAEDLLHDTFINLTLSKPDLTSIENLEGYLFIMMRNLHLSQVRRATRLPMRSFSVVEYDTAEMPFWASDPREHLRMRDELAAVCRVACIRKESSKGGSLLILRFFHGYYPEEIGEIMRTTTMAVNARVKKVRTEIKLYLEEPERLRFIEKKLDLPVPVHTTYSGDDLRLQFRSYIFRSCQGTCISDEELNALYVSKTAEFPARQDLAHIVSCPNCIEKVNSLLGLAPLASRYPADMTGNDPGNKGGTGGGSGTGGSGGRKPMLDSYINRREAHYHHEPRELCIAVNGQFQGLQKIVSGKGELMLPIDINETIGFVEAFSELGVRMLMMNVEPPPVGDGKQTAHVELSGGRTLDANLNFSGPFPTLQISYNDPQLSEATAADISTAPNSEYETISVPFENLANTNASLLTRFKAWLEPMRIAMAATLLIGVLGAIWLVTSPPTVKPPTARAVLKQARDIEFAMAPTAEKVLHRNYQIEEWADGNLRSRRRIDEWQKKAETARRTYDEQGQMIAGTWTKENGSRQIFEQGQRLRTLPKGHQDEKLDSPDVIEPTVNAFANLLDQHGVASRVAIEETATAYTLNFEDRVGETEQSGVLNRLLVASLTLDRNKMLPTGQTLVLQVGDEVREYRYSDVRVEQKPIAEVSPLIFLPDAELAKGATSVTKPLEIELPVSAPPAVTGAAPDPASPTTATLDTEVEVFRALDSINALSGEQITVTRTTTGTLRIVGLVDTGDRKTEVLNALNAVKNSPGVVIDIQTREEAASRSKQSVTSDNISIESVTAATGAELPVEAELRAYFAKKGLSGEALNAEIRRYSGAVFNRSRALRRNALALKSLSERFSPAELDKLDPEKREQWKALLRSKAADVAGDVRSLSTQLSTVGLRAAGDGSPGAAAVRDASDVAQAAQRLFGLAAACDSQVSQSFSISGGVRDSALVKTVQFWRNLRQMADIAAEIQKF